MRFWEAMKHFEEGRRVRCKSWPKGEFILKGDHALFSLAYLFDKERELYEEPISDEKKLLSFQEVVKGLKEGKKFKRKDWPLDVFFEKSISGRACKYGDSYHTLLLDDFEATDWIEVQD